MKKLFLLLILISSVIEISAKQKPIGAPVDTTGIDSMYRIRVHFVDNLSILAGYSVSLHGYGEIGFARSTFMYTCNPGTFAYYASIEIKPGKKPVIGYKIGCWASGGILALGLSSIYYTDLRNGSLCLRPEAGFGMLNLKFVYGYNWALVNRAFPGVDRHMFSLGVLIPVKKIKEERF